MFATSAPRDDDCGTGGHQIVRNGEPDAGSAPNDYCTTAIDRERIGTLYIRHVFERSS